MVLQEELEDQAIWKFLFKRKSTCYLFTITLWSGIIHPTPPHTPIYPVVLFTLFFFFWLCLVACRILMPWLGIEPGPGNWKHQVLTTEQMEFAFMCHFNDVVPSPPPGVTTYLSPLSLPELILIMHPRYSNAVVSWVAHSIPKRKKEPTLNPGLSS